MPFRYLRDPLFLASVAIYVINRWCLEAVFPTGFCHSYVNDLLCIPFWVPVMVWALRKVGLRDSDSPPDASEILIPLLLWSVVFEIVLPRVDTFAGLVTSDHMDVLCYALGALAASIIWRHTYATPQDETSRHASRA